MTVGSWQTPGESLQYFTYCRRNQLKKTLIAVIDKKLGAKAPSPGALT